MHQLFHRDRVHGLDRRRLDEMVRQLLLDHLICKDY
jgi:hypothetical protein